jgi:hypothetical protein
MTHEVYSDGADIALSVCVVSEPQQQTGFAHARVANQKQLEQVIAACKTTSRQQQQRAPSARNFEDPGQIR